jgi:pimeloyl-ACP methyl ester carboxylesterase
MKTTRSPFVCLLMLSLFCITRQNAQELPRRVYLGIRMENLTDDLKNIMGLAGLHGVLIAEVLPSSTAEKAGFQRGDILKSVNGTIVNATTEVIASLSGRKPGEEFAYELLRNKKSIKGKAVFQAFPKEKYTGLDVIYTESKSAIGLERTIITKPKIQKKLPVIVFIGGIGCYSLDFPMDSTRGEVELLTDLSRAGFLCARLEKPGMGDNAKFCKACAEVSFTEETKGYVEAIKALKQRPDADSSQIFIFGHSMGGVFAPLIARQTPIKGIIAYGTIGSNFIEYLAKTRRTIAQAYQMTPDAADALVKDFCECADYYFVEKMTTEQASTKNPGCKEYLSIFDLRSRAYNDELYAFNIPSLWKPYDGKVLILWGESDYISSREDHQIITDAVNFYHPGNSIFNTIKSADHGMNVARDFQEAQKTPGKYNQVVSNIVIDWLNNIN